MKVELEVPREVEREAEEFVKNIDWKLVLQKALVRELQEELEVALLKRIASKSKLTEEEALRLGNKIKEGIARRHGL